MTSATTGDIETICLLNAAVKKHRGRPEGWARFGAQLAARRTQLGYPDGRREQLVRDRSGPGGLTGRDAYKMEHGIDGDRKAWPTQKLIAAASVYAINPKSIPVALDGGDIEPVPALASSPAPAPRGGTSLLLATAVPPAVWDGLRMSGVPAEKVIYAAAPHATAILTRLIDLAADGKVRPAGYDVFPGDDAASRAAARRWDLYAEDMPENDIRAWYIATKAVAEASGPQLDTNVG